MERNWDEFVKKALDKIIHMNRHRENKSIMYAFNYEGDSVEMILEGVTDYELAHKNSMSEDDDESIESVMGYELAPKKSISVDKEQYYSGNVNDDEFIEDCIKRISP